MRGRGIVKTTVFQDARAKRESQRWVVVLRHGALVVVGRGPAQDLAEKDAHDKLQTERRLQTAHTTKEARDEVR